MENWNQGLVVARGRLWQRTRQGASFHLNTSNVLDPSGALLPFVSPPIPGFPCEDAGRASEGHHKKLLFPRLGKLAGL